MKPRVAELMYHDLNTETRPYRILGIAHDPEGSSYPVVEYLDVYEYMDIHFHRYDENQHVGWGIYKIYTDADNDLAMVLRRVKPDPETEAAE